MSQNNNSLYISELRDSDDDELSCDESIDSSTIVMEISSIVGDDDEYDDYSLDTQDIDICEQICHEESFHFYEDKTDKQYYIGTCCRPPSSLEDPYLIMSSSISPATFYRHKFNDVIHYLWLYSVIRTTQSRFEIMQLDILPNGLYNVILKTFWLRIVQRTWKRIYQERKEIWRKRMTMVSLRHREIRGRYPSHIHSLPGLLGMI